MKKQQALKGRHGPSFILGLHLPLEDAMGFFLVVTLLVTCVGNRRGSAR